MQKSCEKIKLLLSENKLFLMMITMMVILRFFVFSVYTVEGQSMDYTFTEGDRIIGVKHSHIDRFDIVTFHAPGDKLYVKRVIGLPGDQIRYQDDQLYINDLPYEEPYLAQKQAETLGNFTRDFEPAIVPEGYYFVLGDNRRNSTDSRQLGFIETSQLDAEVKFRIWPLDQWAYFD